MNDEGALRRDSIERGAARYRAAPSAASHAAGGSEVLFDYDASLSRLGGDRELFHEILDIFLEDAPTLLEKAAHALANGDTDTLGRSAHSLKGLSANFAAAPTVAAAYAVELHAREHDLKSAAICFQELETQLHRLDAALRELRDQGRKP
jgi:HPt (histidine-containing phosphotransfer) domain-containing protein